MKRRGDAEDKGETVKSAYGLAGLLGMDRISPKECARRDRNGADTARHPRLRRGRVDRGTSGNPRSLSEMLRRRPSNKGSSASGVDSKEDDDDWRLWCRRVGVWGVIDSAANSSVNSGRKV